MQGAQMMPYFPPLRPDWGSVAFFCVVLAALGFVVWLAGCSAPCYYRMDSQGYYKICNDKIKCTSQKRLPNPECE